MEPVLFHPWSLSEDDACMLQQQLATQVSRQDEFFQIRYIAGVDVAYSKVTDQLVAAVVVLDAETLLPVETAVAYDHVTFPYISGLFSFREVPPLLKAFAQLKHVPDLVICDGQGIAHPRGFGLACHLGLLFDVPSIGCGKTRLWGKAMEPAGQRGAVMPLCVEQEVVGNVLRTQQGVKPVYVSIGHRISLESACHWVLHCSPRFRLPETTRLSDQAVRQALIQVES